MQNILSKLKRQTIPTPSKTKNFYLKSSNLFVCLLFVVGFLGFANVAGAATYYVDNTIEDCVNYDPVAFICGTGTYQAYNTMADVQTNVSAGNNTIYVRRGQTFAEATRFRPKASWIIDAFGTGDRPILSFSVDYAIDIRSDAPGVYWNHLDIRSTSGVVRLYGSGSLDLNMTDVAITAGGGGIGATPTAALSVTLNLSNVTVVVSGVANALVSATNSTFTGTINSSSFTSEGSHSISFQNGLISNLTISNSSASNGIYNGINATGDINGLYLTNFTANENGTAGVSIYPSAGKSQSNIVINGGQYNNNITHGVGINVNATGVLDGVTITGAEVAYNKIDGINTYGVINNLIIENSNIHDNGTDVNYEYIGRGDGVALHGTTTAIVRYNRLYKNYKYQLHSIDNCITTAYGNIIYSDIDIPAGDMIWLQNNAVLDFYNNTVVLNVDSPTTGMFLIGSAVTETQDIYNNVSYGGTYSIDNNSAYSPSLNIDYNNYHGQTSGTIDGSVDGGHSIISNPELTNIVANDFRLTAFSPAIDAGTTTPIMTSTTTDYAGNPIYGTPDIGAYEYQPPYTIGTHDINDDGSIRIYADGKYRYKEATSGSSIDFSVEPVGGYGTGDYNEYMDVTIDTWETSGDQNKQWTATSSVATSTIYTIGDLLPSKQYTFKLDGVASSTAIEGYGSTICSNSICTSDSSGNLSFTYTGGYSTHTFSLEKVADVVVTTSSSSSSGSSVQGRVKNLIAMGKEEEAQKLQAQFPNSSTNESTPKENSTTRDLKLGDTGTDVKTLQIILNLLGYQIAPDGLDSTGSPQAGSVGNETEMFGALTKQALIKFQIANNITPAVGYFGPLTREALIQDLIKKLIE